MLTSDFDYNLPPDLIAQEPPVERGTSRMLVVKRESGCISHRSVKDLPQYLQPGDLMIFNDTRVFPARLLGHWGDSGGRVELLLIEPAGGGLHGDPFLHHEWYCMIGSGRPVRSGQQVVAGGGALRAEIVEQRSNDTWQVRFLLSGSLLAVLEEYGRTPVPPYIRRSGGELEGVDRERYQTLYARERGAVAAPTAGLHFDRGLLQQLAERGVEQSYVTLHVGPGTFKPVKCERVEQHLMEGERYRVPEESAAAIDRCRGSGGRVVAVGSTSVRTLESVAAANGGEVVACEGVSNLFIYPPYRFRQVDVVLTNFHLPQSTLLMMVSAFAGRELILEAYAEAVRERYRFFSYGDCMLIMR